jgi:putative GTP pyrophosphokinase
VTNEISKTQIDRLGARLKKGNLTEGDLRLLDEFRRSFTEAYDSVVIGIRRELALEPTGRPAKSTTSIVEKLGRESIRLSQIQDIAGCRLIVSDIANQEQVVQSLTALFDNAVVIDRRKEPSHGYRAVHVVVRHGGKVVEIQVRTSLQHLWAELSEKLADLIGASIKYGGGDERFQEFLISMSSLIAKEESNEKTLAQRLLQLSSQPSLDSVQRKTMTEIQHDLDEARQQIFKMLEDTIAKVVLIAEEKK